MRLLLTLFLLAFALNPVSAAPARADWTRTVALSPTGGHLLGNPKAATRIVAFFSYTCPHCAHFESEGIAPLKAGWIRPGTASFEVRNLVRDRYDLTAALIARCGGPARFYGNHQAIFAGQAGWISRIQAYEAAPSTLPDGSSQVAVLQNIAEKTGLMNLMAKRGFSPVQLRNCIADPKAMAAILAMTRDAIENVQATGTPSFVINGALTEAHDWKSLHALLPGALPARSA